MYQVHGQLDNGFYSCFSVASGEEQRKALRESFSTPEQRAWNATRQQCGTCKGWGYKRYKAKSGAFVRENVGCPDCLGLGTVEKTT